MASMGARKYVCKIIILIDFILYLLLMDVIILTSL